MNRDIFQKIQINMGTQEVFQPILFLSDNLELFHQELKNFIYSFFSDQNIDKNYLYVLSDHGEKIKINEVREFFWKWVMKPSFWNQVFLIENILRATQETYASALKFLEEPWVWNIVFLTAQSEAWIPETILSRLQIIHFSSEKIKQKNDFFYQLIDDYFWKRNMNLFKYFFQDKKIQKEDYIHFLDTFIFYIQENLIFWDILEKVIETKELIEKNNALPKYEIDRLFLKI